MATSKRRRSKFETKVDQALAKQGVVAEYEAVAIPFDVPHTYNPDYLLPNGILLEAKGYFSPEDRREMLAVVRQHPALDIRMLFQRAKTPIRKGSKTTYGMWCAKHNIPWCDITDTRTLRGWTAEAVRPLRLAAAKEFYKR